MVSAVGSSNNESDFSSEERVNIRTNTGRFPIRLRGRNLPEEASINLNVRKPSNITGDVRLTLVVFDADLADEGELEINGKGPIQLFGGQGTVDKDNQTVPITLATPSAWWKDGANTLRFVHISTRGYRIDSAAVDFDAPKSGFPVVLRGRNHPEEATVSLDVNKPSGASGTASLTMTVFDGGYCR